MDPRVGLGVVRREKPVACAGIRNPRSSTPKIQNITNVVRTMFKCSTKFTAHSSQQHYVSTAIPQIPDTLSSFIGATSILATDNVTK
jgi:hypothetical protein